MNINFSYLKTIIVWYLSYFRSRNKYLGHFSSFREAYAKCKNKGYKDKNLLNKIIDINKKVKAGEVIAEQDGTELSYIINNANLNFNILNLYNKKKKLIIIDFGGSLGNVYRNFFHFSEIKCNWNIIEQPALVDAGKKFFKSPNLNFYTLKESIRKKSIILKKKRGGGGIKNYSIEILILSSVIMLLPNPYSTIKYLLLHFNPLMIIIDRTLVYHGKKDFYVVCETAKHISSKHKYPCAFLSKERLVNFFVNNDYQIIENWKTMDLKVVNQLTVGSHEGFAMVKKNQL